MANKRAKPTSLVEMGRKSYVSMSGLERVLREVKDNGLPECFSRSSQFRARKVRTHHMTPYGPLVDSVVLPCIKKGDETIGYQNPQAMLYQACKESESFAALVMETTGRVQGERPLRICLYSDGISPSDGLTKFDRRKSVALYWSFFEFGAEALSHEEVWLTLADLRNSLINDVDGGLSHVTKILLLKGFFDVHGNDIKSAGVFLPICNSDRTVHLRADVGCVVSDMLAIDEMCLIKGTGGVKFCLICGNAINNRYPDRCGPGCFLLTHLTFTDFKRHSRETILQMFHNLEIYKATLEPGEFAEKEILYGFNFNLHNILLDNQLALDITAILMFDWMHIYLVGGLLDKELGLTMTALRRAGSPLSYSQIGSYVEQWSFPKSAPQSFGHLFDDKASTSHHKAEHFGSKASDLLWLTPVLLRLFVVAALAQGYCIEMVESLIACLEVVYMLPTLRRGAMTPHVFMAYIMNHLTRFKKAWGDAYMRPKHHFSLHLPRMLAVFGFLISCFTHERKHRLVRRYGFNRRNTTAYEMGIIEDITVHSLQELKLLDRGHGIKSLGEPKQRMRHALNETFPDFTGDFKVGNVARGNDGMVHVGDVAFFQSEGRRALGQVIVHVAMGRADCTIVSKWQLVSMDDTSAVYRVVDAPCVIETNALECSVIYSRTGDDAIVLVPPLYRN